MKHFRLTNAKYRRKNRLKHKKALRKRLFQERKRIEKPLIHNAKIIVYGLSYDFQNDWDIECFKTYLRDNITKRQANYAVRAFNQCNCCENHKITRPKALCKRIHTQQFTNKLITCGCECRHLSRNLCDTFYP
jgi:hypothetical protein